MCSTLEASGSKRRGFRSIFGVFGGPSPPRSRPRVPWMCRMWPAWRSLSLRRALAVCSSSERSSRSARTSRLSRSLCASARWDRDTRSLPASAGSTAHPGLPQTPFHHPRVLPAPSNPALGTSRDGTTQQQRNPALQRELLLRGAGVPGARSAKPGSCF